MTTFSEMLTQNIAIKNDIKDALSMQQSMDGVKFDEYADIIRGALTKRWGIRITKADSNPDTRVTYLYDAVGMTPAAMNYTSGEFEYGDWKPFCDAINRPVMLLYNGTVDYELHRDDQTKKLDGVTASDIANTAYGGNAMAEFRRLWLRTYEDATYQYIIFSNVQ